MEGRGPQLGKGKRRDEDSHCAGRGMIETDAAAGDVDI
jgi:hypothetical protein